MRRKDKVEFLERRVALLEERLIALATAFARSPASKESFVVTVNHLGEKHGD